MKVKCDHRSKFFQFKQLESRSLKKIRASTGFEPMTSAIPVRCSTNWAMKPHIGSKVNLLSSFLPVQWDHVKYIWNNSYLYCGMRWRWSVIIAVNFSNLSNWKVEAWKKSGLQRDSNPWPPRYRYHGGHGFESRWSPDFFQASTFQLLKVEKFTAMITLHFHYFVLV